MPRPTRCPRCGRENDASLAFCLDCGQPLRAAPAAQPALACASCGATLQPGFRFCGTCGTPSRAAPPTPRRAPPVPPLPPGSSAPGGAAPASPGGAPPARIRLAQLRSDGRPGVVFALDGDEAVCGRTDGDIRLGDDPGVSPRHARFSVANGVLRVEDLGSANGTFLRLREPRRIEAGEELRVGLQLLRLEPLPRPPSAEGRDVLAWGAPDPGYRLRLSQLLEGGGLGEIFPLRPGENVIGREAGEVTFPGDRYVSARHARLVVSEGGVTLSDLGSSNGTFVRIGRPAELAPGDELLVGAQLLRAEG